jgi:hypothetical protein
MAEASLAGSGQKKVPIVEIAANKILPQHRSKKWLLSAEAKSQTLWS